MTIVQKPVHNTLSSTSIPVVVLSGEGVSTGKMPAQVNLGFDVPEEVSIAVKDAVEMRPVTNRKSNGTAGENVVENTSATSDVLYGVDDVPPWHLCLFMGLQHFFTMFGGTLAYPYILTEKICMHENDPARGDVIATTFFVSGLATLLQSVLGVRLPIVQSTANTFLVSVLAIISLPKWRCPTDDLPRNESISLSPNNFTDDWKDRMREIQGSMVLASMVEVLLGLTGLTGILLRWVSPLTIVVTVSLVGFFLFDELAELASGHWGIAIGTIIFLTIFSQYLQAVTVPCLSYRRNRGWKTSRFPLFQLFPVILTLLLMWLLCVILTAAGAFAPGHPARTDLRTESLHTSRWFRIPYPLQWGSLTYSAGAVLGLSSAMVASVLESIGDYYACARLAGAPPPPTHAVNRGIFAEGFSCVLSGLFGTGTGTTSYSTNIGVVGITKVGSRRVVLWSAAVMLICGVMSKIGAFFGTIPRPVVGGMMCFLFPVISGVAFSNLQFVDLNSTRNLFILGISIFMGFCIPKWVQHHQGAIDTGSPTADQIVIVLLSTSMAVGGGLACFLDNTIPGTNKERGMDKWREIKHDSGTSSSSDAQSTTSCYDFPFGMTFLRKISWLKYLPISPTYDENSIKSKFFWRKKGMSVTDTTKPPT